MAIKTNHPNPHEVIAQNYDDDFRLNGATKPNVNQLSPREKRIVKGALGVALGVGVLGAMAAEYNTYGPSDSEPAAVSHADDDSATKQDTSKSSISSHETSPQTTVVTVGDGEGPYQVVSRAVEQGIISPEDAPGVQVDVMTQYDQSPGGTKHPNDPISIRVSK